MPVGRPPIGPKLTVRLPASLRTEVGEWAWARGEPVAELVRRAVERECARLDSEIANAVDVRVTRAGVA